MIQTQWVAQQLRQQWPNLDITIEHIRTTGDQITDVPLTRIGGDGVFVTEIEHALHERRIDLAVHSLKDLPTLQPDDLAMAVVGPREDVRDVFVSNVDFRIVEDMLCPVVPSPQLASPLRIGTCSLRRTAQIRLYQPAADILPLRGNVDTRLRKLHAGEYDGIVLAAAGLHRLGLQAGLAGHLTYFPVEMLLPAPGQGALAVECRNDAAYLELLAPLRNVEAQAATTAERAFMRHLGAGCYLPVAAYADILNNVMTLRGLVISLDGHRCVRVLQRVPWRQAFWCADAERLGISLAEQALKQGADDIIRELESGGEQEHSHV